MLNGPWVGMGGVLMVPRWGRVCLNTLAQGLGDRAGGPRFRHTSEFHLGSGTESQEPHVVWALLVG